MKCLGWRKKATVQCFIRNFCTKKFHKANVMEYCFNKAAALQPASLPKQISFPGVLLIILRNISEKIYGAAPDYWTFPKMTTTKISETIIRIIESHWQITILTMRKHL